MTVYNAMTQTAIYVLLILLSALAVSRNMECLKGTVSHVGIKTVFLVQKTTKPALNALVATV